jgi:hypothetical protein
MRMTRTILLPLGVAAVIGLTPVAAASAEDAPAPAPVAPEAAPKARKPLDAKDREKLVGMLRQYLDKDSPQSFEFRIRILEELKRLKEAGVDPLADADALSSMVYAARPFQPLFEKKMLPREAKDAEIVVDSGTGIVNVAWDQLRLSLSLPAGYADLAKNKKLAGLPPFPALVTLHDLEDFQDAKGTRKFPGMEAIKRRWDRNNKALKPVVDGWFLFAPVATRARFVEEGRVKPERVPLEQLWRRYHVDFDRIVLEGGSDALAFAASQPNFLAGVVVRGEKADLDKDLAANLAYLPVYVVGDAPAAKTLAAAGHAADLLTTGPLEGLPAWLASVPRRRIARDFTWVVKDPDAHSFAHWISLDVLDPGAERPMLRVACLDTKEDPNTVRVDSRGVRGMSIFLSDRQVDLDRDVRLVINGEVVKEARVPSNKPSGRIVSLPGRFDRTLDGVFDHPQVDIRGTLYFGWYYPVSLLRIPVPGDAKAEAMTAPEGPSCPKSGGTTPAPEASDQAEREASTYFAKAQENEKAGNLVKALDLYRKAVAAGESTVKVKAEAKVKELESKAGDGPK